MPYEQRANSATLFANKKKGGNERAPDMKGEGLLALPDGSTVKIELAAWKRLTKHGDEFLNLVVKIAAPF
jgi:hypothetical protein